MTITAWQRDAVVPYELSCRSRAVTGGIGTLPLHVLTLTPFYPTAADDARGCFVAEPLQRLAAEGVRQTVIAVDPAYRPRPSMHRGSYPATWMRYLAVPGMGGLAVSGKSLFFRLRTAVRRIHAKNPINLIHAHAALPCGHAAALIKQDLGIPFVVSVHGRDVFSARARGVAAQWRERVSKLVYQSADRVICVSGKVEDEIARAVQCHSSIIYNGVDPELFYPEPSGSVTDPIVLSVGNLIPSKGHDILLKSIAAIASRHPLVHCRIVGDGPDRRRLEKLANELGISERVRFMGRRSHAAVAALMRACAVFVLSSWYEALGCAYLEAMACAKPVIGCFGQGIAEIIHTGHNGWIVAPNDVEELSHALDSLLHDRNLRAQLGTEARRTILAGFTLQHQAKRLVQTYEECAN